MSFFFSIYNTNSFNLRKLKKCMEKFFGGLNDLSKFFYSDLSKSHTILNIKNILIISVYLSF
jgi:hypothetical protein